MSGEISTQTTYTSTVDSSYSSIEDDTTSTESSSNSSSSDSVFSYGSFAQTSRTTSSDDELMTDMDESVWSEAANFDSLEDNNVTTQANATHIVTQHGKTAIYNISGAPDGSFTLQGVPNHGFVRATPGEDSGTLILEVLVDGKVVDTVKINYPGNPPPSIFIQGGTHIDTSAIEALAVGKTIYWNKTANDLPKETETSVTAGELFQLAEFRYIGDKDTLVLTGEDTVIDLIGDGSTAFKVNTKKTGDDLYEITITVSNENGETDTVVLKDVPLTTKINLFGGNLVGDVPEALQGVFPKNYDIPTLRDKRLEKVDEKMSALDAQLKTLPPVDGLNSADSQKLYKDMLGVYRNATNFLTGKNKNATSAEKMETFIHSVQSNHSNSDKLLSSLIGNMTTLLANDYPELLKSSGELGINDVLSAELIKSNVTKDEIRTFALLQFFAGEEKDDIKDTLSTLKDATSMKKEAWDKALNSGLASFNLYLSSGTYHNYETMVNSKDYTLQASDAELEELETAALQTDETSLEGGDAPEGTESA